MDDSRQTVIQKAEPAAAQAKKHVESAVTQYKKRAEPAAAQAKKHVESAVIQYKKEQSRQRPRLKNKQTRQSPVHNTRINGMKVDNRKNSF